MSIKSILSAGTVLLLLGSVASAYGQGDQKGEQRPAQSQAAPQQAGQSRGLTAPSQAPHNQLAAPQQAGQTRGLTPPSQAPHNQLAAPQQGGQTRGLTRGLTQQPQAAPQPTSKPAPTTTQRSQPAYGAAYHGGVKATAPTNGGVHPSGVPQAQAQARSGFLQSRGNWSTDHRTWQQRGGYTGYRIPDNRFSLYFGTGHFFHIGSLPLLFVGGYPRFQYDGYWVTLMDPWPDTWPPLWYETDNVYIDWGGDGYYLYDTNYPGIGIAVQISF
ncbi:MAG: hypothetical protein ABSG84_11380 [Acidobacteriaceae bacterium]|jgi:hypothetical protein